MSISYSGLPHAPYHADHTLHSAIAPNSTPVMASHSFPHPQERNEALEWHLARNSDPSQQEDNFLRDRENMAAAKAVSMHANWMNKELAWPNNDFAPTQYARDLWHLNIIEAMHKEPLTKRMTAPYDKYDRSHPWDYDVDGGPYHGRGSVFGKWKVAITKQHADIVATLKQRSPGTWDEGVGAWVNRVPCELTWHRLQTESLPVPGGMWADPVAVAHAPVHFDPRNNHASDALDEYGTEPNPNAAWTNASPVFSSENPPTIAAEDVYSDTRV